MVYKKTKQWEEIYQKAKSYFSKKAAVCHYYGTAQSTFQNYLQKEQVRYKKYFYALRPLLACRYVDAFAVLFPARAMKQIIMLPVEIILFYTVAKMFSKANLADMIGRRTLR